MPPILGRTVAATTALIGVLSAAAGAWALIAPVAFYRVIAPFPPYSQHLIHDIGSFQLGLGACLLAALLVRDALLAVLLGNSVGATAHVASHLMDRAYGGHRSDPFSIGAIALLLVGLTIARWVIARRVIAGRVIAGRVIAGRQAASPAATATMPMAVRA